MGRVGQCHQALLSHGKARTSAHGDRKDAAEKEYKEEKDAMIKELTNVRFCMRRRIVHSHDASVQSTRDS